MTERPLCRHYHPLRYAWGCATGYHAPRDCGSCTKYDPDPPRESDDDTTRTAQWKKSHDRRPV
jgi:hypothetical protein